MNASATPAASTADREIIQTRTFDAPRALVWQAWTDLRHVCQWWGPNGFTNTYQAYDLQPGGVARFIMHGPDGTDYPNQMVFSEVVAPERLVYKHGSGEDNDPHAFDVTISFVEQDGKTTVTMRTIFPTAEDLVQAKRIGAVELGQQTLQKLAGYLPLLGEKSPTTVAAAGKVFTVSRVFNAPRPLVFAAFTEAERLKHWWGPYGWSLPVCKLDFRVGGVWHYCMRGPLGEESWGKGIYQEIVAPERIVYVDAFSDAEGNVNEAMPVMTIRVEFEDLGGKTRVTSDTEFPTEEVLAQIREMGMEQGVTETWDRLEHYLATA